MTGCLRSSPCSKSTTSKWWHGWRRAFATLFDFCHANPRVKNLITGHEQLLPTTHGSTREQIHLNKEDLRLLSAAQALCEHVRTEYSRSGVGPRDVSQGRADANHP